MWTSRKSASSNSSVAITWRTANATVTREQVARIGYEFGVAAALCWLAFGVGSIIRPEQIHLHDLFWVLPALPTAVTFWCVHLVQTCQDQESEGTTHRVWQISCALTILANLSGELGLSAARLPYTPVLWAITLVAFGIGTWKAAVFPRYVAVTIMLLEPASNLLGLALFPIGTLQERGGYSGALETAFGMAVLAIGLHSAAERLHWKSLDLPEGRSKRAALQAGIDCLRVPSL